RSAIASGQDPPGSAARIRRKSSSATPVSVWRSSRSNTTISLFIIRSSLVFALVKCRCPFPRLSGHGGCMGIRLPHSCQQHRLGVREAGLSLYISVSLLDDEFFAIPLHQK